MTLEQIVDLIEWYYERAKNNQYIQNPMAWALYQVWRRVDKEDSECRF